MPTKVKSFRLSDEDAAKLEAALTRENVGLSDWIKAQLVQTEPPARGEVAEPVDYRRFLEDLAVDITEEVRGEVRRALGEYARVAQDAARAMVKLALLEAVAGPALEGLQRMILNPKQATHADVYNVAQALWRWITTTPEADVTCPAPERLARSHAWLARELRLSELLAWVITGVNPAQPV